MSGGGLTPCRQLRPSSRREHVSASNSHVMGGGERNKEKKKRKKEKEKKSLIVEKLIKVYTAQLPSKNLRSLLV